MDTSTQAYRIRKAMEDLSPWARGGAVISPFQSSDLAVHPRANQAIDVM